MTAENCKRVLSVRVTLIEAQINLQTGKYKVMHTGKDDPNFLHTVIDFETYITTQE